MTEYYQSIIQPHKIISPKLSTIRFLLQTSCVVVLILCTLVSVCFVASLLGFQAREKILNVRTLRCGLMEGIGNLSVISHNEITSHNEWVITFIFEFRKRYAMNHLPLSITVHSIVGCYYASDPSQSQLPVHLPLRITVGWKLNWIFLSPDDPIFQSPICEENDLAPILLEFRQCLLHSMTVVVTRGSGKMADENEQGVG